MNNLIKMAPLMLLVLVLFTGVNPAAATNYLPSHIEGLHNVTVVQGEDFIQHIKVVFDGIAGDNNLMIIPTNYAGLKIIDSNNCQVASYIINFPRFNVGDDLTIHTSNLAPGKYTMEAYYIGDNIYDPCRARANLTIVPTSAHRPVASDINITTTMDHLFVNPLNVIDSDNDIGGFEIVDSPIHGDAITFNFDGINYFRYIPNSGFVGNDSFTYKAIDKTGLESNTARVNVQVR